MDILAIIPARSGSKGVSKKNIRSIGGKPLIEYTINSAKKSKKINKIILTTDSKEIANFAKKKGIEVPFLRPKKFSKDDSSALDYVKHALKFLEQKQSYIPDIILILQPTSPIRKIGLIDKSISLLKKSKASCVLTVTEVKNHPYLSFWYPKKRFLKPLKSDFKKFNRRQKFPTMYYPTGSVYAFWYKTIQKYDSFYGQKIKPIIIDQEDSIDIDSIFDFFMAEMKILHWKKYKKS